MFIPSQIDSADKTVILRTLKQRRADVYRQIHLPDHLLSLIQALLEVRIMDGSYQLNTLLDGFEKNGLIVYCTSYEVCRY